MNRNSYKGYTKARREANAKYKADKLESIQLYVPKGRKEQIKAYAKLSGESMKQFINHAIEDFIKDKGLEL